MMYMKHIRLTTEEIIHFGLTVSGWVSMVAVEILGDILSISHILII